MVSVFKKVIACVLAERPASVDVSVKLVHECRSFVSTGNARPGGEERRVGAAGRDQPGCSRDSGVLERSSGGEHRISGASGPRRHRLVHLILSLSQSPNTRFLFLTQTSLLCDLMFVYFLVRSFMVTASVLFVKVVLVFLSGVQSR